MHMNKFTLITMMVISFLGCNKEAPTSPQEKGQILLAFSLKAAEVAGANITRVNVSVSKDSFTDSLDLAVSADSAWGTFTNLIPGTYSISVKVYNGTTVLGTGSGQGTVFAGQTTTVRITINLDSGNLQVIVDWNLFSSITFSGRSVSGLAFSSGYLWALHQPAVFNNTYKIAKIDPSTRQIVLESGNINGNGRGITVGSGALWVTEATADVVSKLDTATFTQLASFSTPGTEPCGIAFDGTNLWLSDPYFQKIYKLNTSGGVLSNFAIPNYHRNGLEWNNGGLWTPTDSNMVSFYTTTGTITSTKILQFPTGYYGFIDIAIGNGNAYISSHEKIFIQTWP